MRITFDPAKRARTIAKRSVDFLDAAEVFSGDTLDFPDARRDYGETRIVTIGHFKSRMVVIVWTQRGTVRHIISMRKANDREKKKYGHRLGQV